MQVAVACNTKCCEISHARRDTELGFVLPQPWMGMTESSAFRLGIRHSLWLTGFIVLLGNLLLRLNWVICTAVLSGSCSAQGLSLQNTLVFYFSFLVQIPNKTKTKPLPFITTPVNVRILYPGISVCSFSHSDNTYSGLYFSFLLVKIYFHYFYFLRKHRCVLAFTKKLCSFHRLFYK